MNKLGVLLTDLRPSQQSYLALQYMNSVVASSNIDCTVFCEYSRFTPCVTPNFAVMDMAECWAFDGLLISTNLSNTKLMMEALCPAKKVFYVWDLEWLRNKKNFVENIEIYRSPKIDLITRSLDHSLAIKNYANREPKMIVPQFNLGVIINEYFK